MQVQLPKYLPLIDPDYFSEVSFYQDLEKIGYQTILLGGTGSRYLRKTMEYIREYTSLKIILYPAGPDSVCEADLVIMPDVMNSNSHYARPFGSGSVITAVNIAKSGLDFLPVAYFIMGESTARWYFDAFLIHSEKLLLGYCTYAKMVGYKHITLDYEGVNPQFGFDLITKIKAATGLHITVSDEVNPEEVVQLLQLGTDTVVTPSDLLEEAPNPVQLAQEYYDFILKYE